MIKYSAEEKIFHLQTRNTSYVMGVFREKHLIQLYYGKKIKEYRNIEDNFPVIGVGAFVSRDIPNCHYTTNNLPTEYPCYGSVDVHTPAFHAIYADGSHVTKLEYAGHEIFSGKKPLKGLPATYAEEGDNVETLEVTLRDELKGLEIILSYTVFEDTDAIAKSVRVKNNSADSVSIKSVLSSVTHVFDKDYEFVHLEGSWARERSVQRVPLMNGTVSVDSKRLSSSHDHSPFVAIARKGATENTGEVIGHSFVYSGNHIEEAETDSYGLTTIRVGINPFNFNWILEGGDEFQAPEVIITYSANGFGQMSRNFHKLYRTRLCRGKYRDIERPVLINNWEATYFNFNEEKILNIAKKAKSVGVELMVLDDGWFGKRDKDNCSLGDWYADKRKLPNGIEGIAKKVNDLGMQFGLWFEPEMVSPDSDLYRAHPDWCLHINGRPRHEGRNQLVLDMSRKDVCDYVVEALTKVLDSAPISYVKWDYNRNASEIGSDLLTPERQQEVPHRYMLGLYDVLERITTAFPDVLFEGCSGGGGRYDAGMLPYFSQYWTSDDTDACERLYIQHGTSMVMPSCTMGAHVSAVPNHQINRTTPLRMRGNVAMMGQFGYELDLNKLTDEEIEEVRQQIVTYKNIRETVHKGEMYRLRSPFECDCAVWEYVDENKIVMLHTTSHTRVDLPRTMVKLEGLEEDAEYVNTATGITYRGDYLMNVGISIKNRFDYQSELYIFEKVK